MSQYRTDLSIDHLKGAFQTSFKWTLKRFWDGEVSNFAEAWVNLVASGLNDVLMTASPVIDPLQPFFPFAERHRITTEVYEALRSGGRGGPVVDVLFQIWFDTEETSCAYGIPLLFRSIPKTGRPPFPMWEMLQQDSRLLMLATPSARIVFVSEADEFDWYGLRSYSFSKPGLLAIDANRCAGSRTPPRPVFGRFVDQFCLDLASAWIGDPALSGREPNGLLDEFLMMHQVNCILRIRVERESRERHVEQMRMGF